MSTTHLWALIQEWMDAQFFKVSQSQLAEKVGVSRSALSQWKAGQAKPSPENLRELHRVTRIEYKRLLDAVVRDMGYLDEEAGGEHDQRSAPRTRAGGGPASNVHALNPPDQGTPPPPADIAARDLGTPSRGQQIRERQDDDAQRGDDPPDDGGS